MGSSVITIVDVDNNPIESLYLEVLDSSTKNQHGVIGPSNSDGECFTSLDPGSYFLSLPVNNKYTSINLQQIVVDDNSYHEFQYTVKPYSTKNTNASDLLTKLINLETKLSSVSNKVFGILDKSDKDSIIQHIEKLTLESDTKAASAEKKFQSWRLSINSLLEEYKKDYWKDPVNAPNDLPVDDTPYSCRVVILPSTGENPALYIKNNGAGWTKLTGTGV